MATVSEESCSIDWIIEKGKQPEKAGIFNEDKDLIREVKYAAGQHIENYFNCSLSELYVNKKIDRFAVNNLSDKIEYKEYTTFIIKKNPTDTKCICFDSNCKNY